MTINKGAKGMRLYLFIFFLMGICVSVSAQQDPMFTQYMHNPVSINPAYAGTRGTLNIVALHRQQWVGVDGAPKTFALSVNSPFNNNVGLGLTLLNDQLGPTKQTGLFGDYSYRLKVSTKTKLAFGLKGGLSIIEKDLSNLTHYNEDEYISLNGYQKLYLPNFGVGSYLYSDRFYIGFSIPKMLQNSLSENTNTVENKEERHYFLTGGVVFDITENIKFKPSTTVRIVKGSPVSTEISAAALLNDKVWLGCMYRVDDAVGAMVKFEVSRQLSLGYSFDYTLSKLGAYTQGTHEVYISYDFIRKSRKVLSPRYF